MNYPKERQQRGSGWWELGIAVGREQGENRINALIARLFEDDRAGEIRHMVTDRDYQRRLLEEYGL